MGQFQKVFAVIGLPEGNEKVLQEKRKGETKEEKEEIMAEIFPNLSKTQVYETH